MADISKIKLPNGTTYNLALPFPRVAKDSHYLPGVNKIVFEEYTNGANYNLPSNAWYHIYTAEGSDQNYATQLALGMTVTGAYYRRYQNGTWTAWESLINSEVQEAKLKWGGQNFSGSYGCIDAAMVSDLNANRFSFLKAAGITVEYTRDGGSTWIDYGATDAQKTGLFNPGYSFVIGKADSTNKATANGTKYQLRVTINTASASIYTELKKIIIYCSTSGSADCKCQISGTLKPATTYTNITDPISISGWSGYNVIQVSFTAGNSFDGQYNNIRFLFTANGGNTTYNGLVITQILGFGGVGWTTPSTMAKTGHLYSYDASQNAAFPAQVTASQFNGALNGNASTATKATQDESGNNIKATYASSFSISDHTITLKNKNGSSLGTVTVPDNNTTYTFANGTNGFTVTPSGGSAQTVTVTPSITNNVTGSGTSGYLAKFNGAHTITNGVALGSSTTTFLRNDGTWATPPSGTDTKNTAGSTNNTGKLFLVGALEQSANPQTYSNSNCYINGSVFYAKGANAVNSNGTTVSALVVDSNQNGQFNVWKADGTPMVWATGSSGQLNCMGPITAIEKVNGANKRRVRHETDTTNHYGKTTWYQGDNVPRVVIQGSNYYEEEYPYPDENKNISLFNKDGEETIYMNSTTGKIHCNQIELVENSGTSRFAKSSGSWTFNNCDWRRYGNVVTVNTKFKGGSSNVSVGSNAIVGTITDIPKPPFTVRLEGYYSGTVLMGELTSTGGFNVRILGQALNLSSSNIATLSGTYVVED